MSILVATDLSDHSRDALRWASALAASRKVPLLVCHVIEAVQDDELWTALFETPEEIEDRVLKGATARTRDFAQNTLTDTPQPEERKILVSVGAAAEEINRFATHHGAGLIVAGTTGHGALRNALFGSTARRLTHESRLPTVFVPPGSPLPPVRRLVVALDLGGSSDEALRWAAKTATEWGSKVVAVHGLGVSALSPDYEPTANFVPIVDAIVEQREIELRRRLTEVGLEGDVVVARTSAAEAVLDCAEQTDADLIVMGTHGRGVLGRLVLGSVANRVLRNTRCPVATIHPS